MSGLKQNRSGQEQFIKQFLHNYLDNPKDQKTVCHILADVGRYYDADCACIFERNEAHTKITRTCEWVCKKTSDSFGIPKHVASGELGRFFDALEKEGEIFISSPDMANRTAQPVCRQLVSGSTGSLMASAITGNGAMIGFLGIYHPRKNTADRLSLSVVASVCRSEIPKKSTMEQELVTTEKAFLGYMKIIQAMSEIYTSLPQRLFAEKLAKTFPLLSSPLMTGRIWSRKPGPPAQMRLSVSRCSAPGSRKPFTPLSPGKSLNHRKRSC